MTAPTRHRVRVLVLAMMLLAMLGLAAAALSGCQASAPGGAALADGAQIENGCLVEAIHARQELVSHGVPAAVLGIYYRIDGRTYGHAVTTFAWRDAFTGTERWAWDRQNSSQPLTSRIDDADGVAAELFARPVRAHVITAPANP